MRGAVDQDTQQFQLGQWLSMAWQPLIDQIVVGLDRVLECDSVLLHRAHRRIYVVGRECDVLNSFAAIFIQVFDDLAFVVRAFVDWNSDLSARARHGFALQPGQLALDVEIADFAKVEQALVVLGPFLHPAAVYVVRQMIDVSQSAADRVGLRA